MLFLLVLFREGAMQDRIICDGCGKKLQAGATICLHCGWDQTAILARPESVSLAEYLKSGGWRLLVYGLLVLLPILGFMRIRTTGPGPDLVTTVRWMIFGDGGRAAELETIHRMHEIGAASSRYSLREVELPPFDGDWHSDRYVAGYRRNSRLLCRLRRSKARI